MRCSLSLACFGHIDSLRLSVLELKKAPDRTNTTMKKYNNLYSSPHSYAPRDCGPFLNSRNGQNSSPREWTIAAATLARASSFTLSPLSLSMSVPCHPTCHCIKAHEYFSAADFQMLAVGTYAALAEGCCTYELGLLHFTYYTSMCWSDLVAAAYHVSGPVYPDCEVCQSVGMVRHHHTTTPTLAGVVTNRSN
jgi:hypothetical protein